MRWLNKILHTSSATTIPDQFSDLTLAGMSVYLEDIPGAEEIEYCTSPELKQATTVLGGGLEILTSIHKRYPSSSDPACLLADCLLLNKRVKEAETVLNDAMSKVKLRSNVAASLGKLYLFYKKDILLSLIWFVRSIIAQRERPYHEPPYLYFSTFLSVLNSKYLVFDNEKAACKKIADNLSGGVEVDFDVWKDIDVRLSRLPSKINSQICEDLQRIFDKLKLFFLVK